MVDIEILPADLDKQPYVNTGVIFAFWGDGTAGQGTFSLVGRNDILTATHVIFDPDLGGWADRIELYFGADYSSSSDQLNSYVDSVVNPRWGAIGWPDQVYAEDENELLYSNEAQFDMAIIGIDEAVGNRLGWMNLHPGYDDNVSATALGYPSYSSSLLEHTATVDKSDPFGDVYVSDYDVFSAGSSGGPLVVDNQVIGVKATATWWADVGFLYDALTTEIADNDSLLTDNTEGLYRAFSEIELQDSHRIAGLYSGFFNRAPDLDGLQYWLEQLSGDGSSLNTLAANFVNHPVFIETYGGLTDREFVEAVYQNMLGGTGDAAGIDYWTNQLETGVSRSLMVSEFVQGSLFIDLDAMWNAQQLTDAEYLDAIDRQNFIIHKAAAGVEFAERLGDESIVEATGVDVLDDPAYLASLRILEGIDASNISYDSTVDVLIDAVASAQDSVDFILESDEIDVVGIPPALDLA